MARANQAPVADEKVETPAPEVVVPPVDDNKVVEPAPKRLTKITAKSETFNGSIHTVRFTDGVAVTDNIAVIGYCQGAGYTVEPTN
jgi:dienelactone hydrolase